MIPTISASPTSSNTIEQDVHAIYKVTNSIRWRCCFRNGRRIETDLPLRTTCVKSTILRRLYFENFKRLLLRHFATLLCVLTARRLICLSLPLWLQRTECGVRFQTAHYIDGLWVIASFQSLYLYFPRPGLSVLIGAVLFVNAQSNRGRCTWHIQFNLRKPLHNFTSFILQYYLLRCLPIH